MRAKRRTADMTVVAEQAQTDRAKHTAQIAQLKDDVHELKGKLDFFERRNIVADSLYSMLSDERDLLKHQIASYEVCSGVMVQRLASLSMDVDALIDDLISHVVYTQKMV